MAMVAEPKKAKAKMRDISVTVPLGEVPDAAYIPDRVDVRLSRRQGSVLKRMVRGLDGQALPNGRMIQNEQDVIRFILEQAADAEVRKNGFAEND